MSAALRRCTAPFALLVLLTVAPAAAAFKNVEEGQRAPDFALPTLEGATIRLDEKVGAKALAVVFWATWSARSKPMLDDLEALYRERSGNGFEVLAVNVEHETLTGEERSNVEAMASQWSFPVLVDEGLGTYYKYGVVATPSLALLDSAGEVRYVRASYSTSARLEVQEAVDGLLGLVAEDAARVAVRRRDYVPPKKATLHYQKAQVLVGRGMGKRAVRDLEAAAKLDEKWVAPRLLLAKIYRSEAPRNPAYLEKAEAALREARGIQPKHVQTLTALAEVLVQRGRGEEALGMAGEALQVEATYTPALLAKARSLRALGKVSEAKATLAEALELDPFNPATLAEQGEVSASLGEWEAAARSLRRAAELALAAGGVEG